MIGFSHVLILAAVFSLIAVTAAVVAAIHGRVRRRRQLRAMMSSNISRLEEPATAPQAGRSVDLFEGRQDALGWVAKEAADGSNDSQAPSGVEPGAVLGREKNILVADDDPVVLYAISRRLQQMGFQVMRSPDASHALLGAMKVLPDLIILDINMPAGNGLAVCEMMACDQRCARIPVIVHSCLTDEAVKLRCQRLGAHYVEKSPRSWNEIKALVESLIGEHKDAGAESTEGEPLAGASAAVPPDQKMPAPVSRQAAPADGSRRAEPAPDRRLVLCLESPKGRLEPIEHQLLALGIEVNRTSDLEEGFWTCFTERPVALVVQIADNKKGLLGLLARLAQHPVTRSLPVLVINENNSIAESDLPSTVKIKIVKHPVDWEGLLCELEAYLPAFHHDELTSPASVAPAAAASGRTNDDPTIGSSQPAAADVSEGSVTILCIDDDPVVAKSIANRLQPYKVKVKGASDGMQGYLLAVSDKPDVILLDLKMPNGEGNYVLGKLKSNSRTKNIPVIVLTVETLAGVRRQMFSIGADAFMSKPIRWPELFTELGRCVQLPKQLLLDYHIPEQLTLSEL